MCHADEKEMVQGDRATYMEATISTGQQNISTDLKGVDEAFKSIRQRRSTALVVILVSSVAEDATQLSCGGARILNWCSALPIHGLAFPDSRVGEASTCPLEVSEKVFHWLSQKQSDFARRLC